MYEINDRAVAWLPPSEIEEAALRQIGMVSRMPFVFRAYGCDARLSPGQGSDGRIGDSNGWRNHTCGSRR